MKKTRLIAALILLLALSVSLCGCGKSEVVASVEAVIENIGTVTLDSRESIAAARTAFDLLPEKMRSQVENAALLTDAETALAGLEADQARQEAERQALQAETAQWLAGQWVYLTPVLEGFSRGFEETLACAAENGITFYEDGTCQRYDLLAPWEMFPDGVLNVGGDFYTNEDYNGCAILTNQKGESYIRREVLDDMFVKVELTAENVGDYVELADIDYVALTYVDERPVCGHWIFMTSKVYDDGLIYFGSKDPAIEVGQPGSSLYFDIHDQKPFGPMWNLYSPYMGERIFAKDCSFGRAQGTVYFVKADYATVTVVDDLRTLQVFGREADPGFLPYYGPEDTGYLYY